MTSNSLPTWLSNTQKGALLQLIVQPRASKTEITGPHSTPPRLRIRIAAPPVDGEANEEVIRFFSKKLGVPKSSLFIMRGESSKTKDLICTALTAEKMLALIQTN